MEPLVEGGVLLIIEPEFRIIEYMYCTGILSLIRTQDYKLMGSTINNLLFQLPILTMDEPNFGQFWPNSMEIQIVYHISL